MARRRGLGMGWIVLLLILVGGYNLVAPRAPPSPSTDLSVTARPPLQVAPAPSSATPGDAAPPQAVPRGGYVTASNLNVRAQPNTTSEILLILPRGTSVTPRSRSGTWLEVQLNNGASGWVSADYVSDNPPPAPARQQVVQAKPSYDRSAVIQAIIRQSITATGGNCPCPYNTDRAGKSCGKRSAYSRPGGASPICYPEQVTQQMIDRYLARQ